MQAVIIAMVTCSNVTMRNKNQVHFITPFFKNNINLFYIAITFDNNIVIRDIERVWVRLCENRSRK